MEFWGDFWVENKILRFFNIYLVVSYVNGKDYLGSLWIGEDVKGNRERGNKRIKE